MILINKNNNFGTQNANENIKNGIFHLDLPNFISHKPFLNIKKGYMFIAVLRGLKMVV